jgi:hypothetical protein
MRGGSSHLSYANHHEALPAHWRHHRAGNGRTGTTAWLACHVDLVGSGDRMTGQSDEVAPLERRNIRRSNGTDIARTRSSTHVADNVYLATGHWRQWRDNFIWLPVWRPEQLRPEQDSNLRPTA